MDSKMTLINENGQSIECDIIARWNQNNRNYIAYTDGSVTDGKLDLLVSKWNIIDNEIKLEVIDDENEWNAVNSFLDNYLYEDGDEDA